MPQLKILHVPTKIPRAATETRHSQINKTKQNKTKKLTSKHKTPSSLAGVRGGRQMGEGGEKVQIPNYKINKLWGCKVQHSDYN